MYIYIFLKPMKKNVNSKNSPIIRKSKNQTKTMRQMRLRLQKKFAKNKIGQKKNSVYYYQKKKLSKK